MNTKAVIRRILWGASVLAMSAGWAATSDAQTRVSLTLEDAIRLASEHSEALLAAKAGESRADADRLRAKSVRMPQVSFAGSYDRTLASEFSALTDVVGGGTTDGFDFSKLPFGQRNIYRLSFSFAQPIYAGGRIEAQRTLAELSTHGASLNTRTTIAQVSLDVTRAYFDAALSDRLVAIAESAYQQASAAFDQARLAVAAGRQPEFEQLRAQVARDNQQPLVIRRKAERDIAYLRLRQLLELPADAVVVLDVDLDAPALPAPAAFAAALAATSADAAPTRVGVEQAQTLVDVRLAAIKIAKSERLPSVNVNSQFGKVGYPDSGPIPGFNDFRTNWTLGAQVTMPLFTGGRLTADEMTARADLAEAEARLKQTKELAELDAATARQDLTAAEAVWAANAGTVQQAQRAYEIADLRYREGLSTQLELSDSRLALQTAQANRAQSARDLQIARARLALLSALPVGAR